jgi:hypothetical protein
MAETLVAWAEQQLRRTNALLDKYGGPQMAWAIGGD